MNDTERAEWVDNDQVLYSQKVSSGKSMREFVRANRGYIDHLIKTMLDREPDGLDLWRLL